MEICERPAGGGRWAWGKKGGGPQQCLGPPALLLLAPAPCRDDDLPLGAQTAGLLVLLDIPSGTSSGFSLCEDCGAAFSEEDLFRFLFIPP